MFSCCYSTHAMYCYFLPCTQSTITGCMQLNARHANGWDMQWPHGMHGWDRMDEIAWMNGRTKILHRCGCTDARLKKIFARMRLHGWTAEQNFSTDKVVQMRSHGWTAEQNFSMDEVARMNGWWKSVTHYYFTFHSRCLTLFNRVVMGRARFLIYPWFILFLFFCL